MCGAQLVEAARETATRGFARRRPEDYSMGMQKEKFKQQEESRDFFCVARDAFRIFARRSSIVLGSAWTFASAVLIIVMRRLHTTLEALKNTLTAPSAEVRQKPRIINDKQLHTDCHFDARSRRTGIWRYLLFRVRRSRFTDITTGPSRARWLCFMGI